jgi:predicted RNA methylase
MENALQESSPDLTSLNDRQERSPDLISFNAMQEMPEIDEKSAEIKFDNSIFQNFTKTKNGKATQYLEYFFQPSFSVDSRLLRLTNISLYSTTPWKEANFISKAIINFYRGYQPHQTSDKFLVSKQFQFQHSHPNYPITITDATANIGGNTISFYLNGINQVNAVEMDELTCEILKNNLNVYHLPTETTYCSDYTQIYKKLSQDVVIIDAPWGGSDYKKNNLLDLYLSDINIIDLCLELFKENRVSLMVLKLPVNYNFEKLFKHISNIGKRYLTHKVYRSHNHHSYNIVFSW